MAMMCACSACGRKGLPRAPGFDGIPVAHVREIRSGGDALSEWRPCLSTPASIEPTEAYDGRYCYLDESDLP